MQTRRLAFLLLCTAVVTSGSSINSQALSAIGLHGVRSAVWAIQALPVGIGLSVGLLVAARRGRPDRLLLTLVGVGTLLWFLQEFAPLLMGNPYSSLDWTVVNTRVFAWVMLGMNVVREACYIAVVPVSWAAAVAQTERGRRAPYLWLTLAPLVGWVIAILPTIAISGGLSLTLSVWMAPGLLIGLPFGVGALLLAWLHSRAWRPVEAGEPVSTNGMGWWGGALLGLAWTLLGSGHFRYSLPASPGLSEPMRQIGELFLIPYLALSHTVLFLIALGPALFLLRWLLRAEVPARRLLSGCLVTVALHQLLTAWGQLRLPHQMTDLRTGVVWVAVGILLWVSTSLVALPALAGALADRLPAERRAGVIGAAVGALLAVPTLAGPLWVVMADSAWFRGLMALTGLLLVLLRPRAERERA